MSLFPEKFFITNPLILEEQNSFKIIGTKAEQFSGIGNFAMTIWNSTCKCIIRLVNQDVQVKYHYNETCKHRHPGNVHL